LNNWNLLIIDNHSGYLLPIKYNGLQDALNAVQRIFPSEKEKNSENKSYKRRKEK
jgi:hypothetical protein